MALPSMEVSFPEPPPDSFPWVSVVRGTEKSIVRLQHLPVTIGRKPEKDVCIADPRMSRDHAAIVAEGGQYYIEDQNSKFGTYLNGVRVNGRRKLSPNDRIEFGHADLGYVLFCPQPKTEEPLPSTDELEARELLTQISEQTTNGGGRRPGAVEPFSGSGAQAEFRAHARRDPGYSGGSYVAPD